MVHVCVAPFAPCVQRERTYGKRRKRRNVPKQSDIKGSQGLSEADKRDMTRLDARTRAEEAEAAAREEAKERAESSGKRGKKKGKKKGRR